MKINVPYNATLRDSNGDTVSLIWSQQFQPNWQAKYDRAQMFVDNQVLRLSVPYLPFHSGMLQKSGTLGTVIGSGTVCYASPYARFLYYGKVMVGIKSRSAWAKLGEKKEVTSKNLKYHGAPKRGAFWFERMKADHGRSILAGARKMMGSG